QHAEQHADLLGWMVVYRASTPGVRVGDNVSVLIDFDNEPQPDALMLIDPARGGHTRIDARGYILGSPELGAEVAASSVSIDLNAKLRVYRRNGVKEYLVWRVDDQAIDYFVLRQGQYDPLPLNAGT